MGTPLPSTPFGWQGQAGCYSDSETGLVYMEARYYAPALGRFLSRDPIGFAGGINLYAYCGGDPVNYEDPGGMDFFGIPSGTIAGAAGFLCMTVISRNPVAGVIGGAAIGTGWSYYRDHKDLKTSIADGCMGGLIGNGIDDGIVALRAYANYNAIPPTEAASEPEVAAEDANSKTFCQLREELQNSEASEVNEGENIEHTREY
jgi:RHS repeat-associated protein